MFKYEKLSVLISCIPFLSHAGAGVRVAEPVAAAEHDSEEDRSMDPYDARDYADQFPYPDDPDGPGSINDENLEILASIMKHIPECINKADFDRLSHLLPNMEPVQVATRTVQEAIAVSYY
jgi:hypothetical protein